MKFRLISTLILSLLATQTWSDEVDYSKEIKPLLSEKCGSCHGALKQEAGLRLDAGRLILQGSSSNPILQQGDSKSSLMIERVASADPDTQMPPAGKGEPLSPQQIDSLRNWIDQGASFPANESVLADPSAHWAYQLPRKFPPPGMNEVTVANPIDAFLRQKQIEIGVRPLDQADRHTLLRRVYFDLIGLPPTRREIDSFIADDSPAAWTRKIDELLENPHYGERWGRHWMDVWRYSDWDGYKNELRGSQRHIWRWRDWIVKSLNEDKSYDQMILEMLAGDEIDPTNPETLAATGFLARNFHKSNRNIWLDATVEHTAKAFLGMTLNCARCHDHKYDPIPQQAYYEFRAIFEPHQVRTDRIPGQPDTQIDGLPRAYDADLDAKTFLYLAGDEKRAQEDLVILPNIPSIIGGEFPIHVVDLPAESIRPGLRDFEVQEEQAKLRTRLVAAEQKFLGSTHHPLLYFEFTVARLNLESFESRLAADRAKTSDSVDEIAVDRLSAVAAAKQRELNLQQARRLSTTKSLALETILNREVKDEKQQQSDIDKAKKELEDANKQLAEARTAREKTDHQYTSIGEVYPATSSGRRLALAHWITDHKNPLTARVAVNRIWMRHFGDPLVDNVFDFGLRSARPVHHELLDWLAVELMDHHWSLKHIHRLILNSQTWQQASSSDSQQAEQNRRIDPDNRFLWRTNARRLDAEIVRDNVLAISGQLDPALGGPDIDFNEGETSRRRSIYLRHAYEKQMTMLVIFDAANPNECYRRSESVIPQQALALVNSSLSLGQSRILARELWQPDPGENEVADQAFLEAAFLQTLGRPPTQTESDACLSFIRQQTELLSRTDQLTEITGGTDGPIKPSTDPAMRARENLIHVLMNHNDFVTVR